MLWLGLLDKYELESFDEVCGCLGLQAEWSGSKPPHVWPLEQSVRLNICHLNLFGNLLSVHLPYLRHFVEKWRLQ